MRSEIFWPSIRVLDGIAGCSQGCLLKLADATGGGAAGCLSGGGCADSDGGPELPDAGLTRTAGRSCTPRLEAKPSPSPCPFIHMSNSATL